MIYDTNEEVNKMIAEQLETVVDDEERWVTINGRHVLIKNGEAQFGGVKISKAPNNFKNGKFVNAEKEFDEAGEKFEKRYKRESERLKREEADIEGKHDKESEKYFKKHRKYVDAYMRLKNKDPQKYEKLMGRVMNRIKERTSEWGLAAEKTDEELNRVRNASNTRKKKLEGEYDKAIKRWLTKTVTLKNKLNSAREKIREARETDKFNKAMGLGKYRKPYYETDAFKQGQERRRKGLEEV